MDVTSLYYTNIPQEEGINIVCTEYETFYNETPPIPKRLLMIKALRVILQENSFQFNKRNYLQTHGTAMGTEMAVAFANIFMEEIKKPILNESAHKPLPWKRYIDDIISGTPAAMSKNSLSKYTNTIQQLNLRLRYHVQMRLS